MNLDDALILHSFQTLERVRVLLRSICERENCRITNAGQMPYDLPAISDYYSSHRPIDSKYLIKLIPVFEGQFSRVAINDADIEPSLSFYNKESQKEIRELYQIFSIDKQAYPQTIFTPHHVRSMYEIIEPQGAHTTVDFCSVLQQLSVNKKSAALLRPLQEMMDKYILLISIHTSTSSKSSESKSGKFKL